jgi:hypothetical protein
MYFAQSQRGDQSAEDLNWPEIYAGLREIAEGTLTIAENPSDTANKHPRLQNDLADTMRERVTLSQIAAQLLLRELIGEVVWPPAPSE